MAPHPDLCRVWGVSNGGEQALPTTVETRHHPQKRRWGYHCRMHVSSLAALLVAALFSIAATVVTASSPSPHAASSGTTPESVVLLHGLGLNSSSMRTIRQALKADGYRVCSVNYPSREHPIDTLVTRFVRPRIARCFPEKASGRLQLHFVTHSMGGILVRRLSTLPDSTQYFRVGRVVMIAPPNQGSEVVDSMAGSWWFGGALDAWGGPAGHELGTDPESMPSRLARLGPPPFIFGVIAANKSLDPLFSEWIAGRDDGKVAVENTKLEGMSDFIEIPASHTLILWKDETV
jgi:triacylglycerol lipase